MVFDLLAERTEAIERGYSPPAIDALRQWIAAESRLANPALAQKVKETGDAALARALQWSQAVNADVERIVRNVPPFPHVRQSVQKIQGQADVIVCSATPAEALDREWSEHDLARYAALICGQEVGTKKEHLHHCAGGGKYRPDRVLMIGDALGDHKAAKDNGFLFYPINPGRESESWRRLHDEALDRFLAGTYAGSYEEQRLEEFRSLLPSTPPWSDVPW
jgi:phosphoglycolate phosphatase-like HAD superfamily hydrolase